MEGTSRRTQFESPVADRDERSIAGLLRELRNETSTLIRQEVRLAQAELSEKVSHYGRNVGYLAVGGMIAYGGVILLLGAAAAFVAWLFTLADVSYWISASLGALIVGTVVAVIGYAFVQKALHALREESPVPEKTIETLKEDKQWAQNKIR